VAATAFDRCAKFNFVVLSDRSVTFLTFTFCNAKSQSTRKVCTGWGGGAQGLWHITCIAPDTIDVVGSLRLSLVALCGVVIWTLTVGVSHFSSNDCHSNSSSLGSSITESTWKSCNVNLVILVFNEFMFKSTYIWFNRLFYCLATSQCCGFRRDDTLFPSSGGSQFLHSIY